MGLEIVEDSTSWLENTVCGPPFLVPQLQLAAQKALEQSPFTHLFIPRVWSIEFKGIME